jgi:hypothetical protein
MGPEPQLKEYEDFIVKWALERQKVGYPVSKEGVLDSVQKLVTDAKLETKFKNNRPGNKWFTLFLKKHKELSLQEAQNLCTPRAKVTEEDCRQWFSEMETYLKEKNCLIFFKTRLVYSIVMKQLYI